MGRAIYVIQLNESKTNYKLGRGHESDINFRDISVSRFHALLTIYKEDELKIEDQHSKFGTLVLINKNEYEIFPEMPYYLQIDACYMVIKAIKDETNESVQIEDGTENGSANNEEQKVNYETNLQNLLSSLAQHLSPISGNIADIPDNFPISTHKFTQD